MYPFFNDIGKMKVSEAIPLLGLIASDYKLNIAIVPPRTDGQTKIHDIVFRNNHDKIAERILRNSQRNN